MVKLVTQYNKGNTNGFWDGASGPYLTHLLFGPEEDGEFHQQTLADFAGGTLNLKDWVGDNNKALHLTNFRLEFIYDTRGDS